MSLLRSKVERLIFGDEVRRRFTQDSPVLPEVWIPDEATLARRRQVTRRNQLVKSRVRLKAIVHSILHAHLVPRCPHADLFGGKGGPGCGRKSFRRMSARPSSVISETTIARPRLRLPSSATSQPARWKTGTSGV